MYNDTKFIKILFYTIEKFFTILVDFVITLFSIILGLTCFVNNMTRLVKNCGKFTGALKALNKNEWSKQSVVISFDL